MIFDLEIEIGLYYLGSKASYILFGRLHYRHGL